MDGAAKIVKYEVRDILRSRWILGYGVFFIAITQSLFQFGGSDSRVIVSLMNVVFIVVPLVSILFGTMYLYQSREFVELLLCQPLRRDQVFIGLFAGLVLPLVLCVVGGIGLPFLAFGMPGDGAAALWTLLGSGVLLTIIFSGIAAWIVTAQEDRSRGFGLALLIWFFLSVFYDGLILLVIYYFGDYPIEYPVIALSLLNPVDLARITMLTKIDISALLGYTGAVFQQFFGSPVGVWVSLSAMLLWCAVPITVGFRRFLRKDF